MSTDQQSCEKEWHFDFGIYANDDCCIDAAKCEELMDMIVKWAEEHDMSCGGGFARYETPAS